MSQSTLFGPGKSEEQAREEENAEYLRTKRMAGVKPDADMLWSLDSTISEDRLGVWWGSSRCTKHPGERAVMFLGETSEYLCETCRELRFGR